MSKTKKKKVVENLYIVFIYLEKSKFSDFSQIAHLPTTNALTIRKEKHPLDLVKSYKNKIENNTNKEKLKIKNEEKRVLKTIFMMDMICMLSDLFCVTILYFDVISIKR